MKAQKASNGIIFKASVVNPRQPEANLARGPWTESIPGCPQCFESLSALGLPRASEDPWEALRPKCVFLMHRLRYLYWNITILDCSSFDGLSLDAILRNRLPDVISLAMIHSDKAQTGHRWASSSGNGYK